MLDQVRRQMGGQLDPETLRALNLAGTVTQRMVDEAAIDQSLARLGIIVSDDAVRAQILADRASAPHRAVRALHVHGDAAGDAADRAAILRDVRRDLARDALAETLVAGTRVPDVLVDRLYRLRQERRVAQYVAIANNSIADPASPPTSSSRRSTRRTRRRSRGRNTGALTVLRIGPTS